MVEASASEGGERRGERGLCVLSAASGKSERLEELLNQLESAAENFGSLRLLVVLLATGAGVGALTQRGA